MNRPVLRSCAAWACLVLPLLLFPLWTAARIWSFSFGADPRMFLSLANGLAQGHPLSEVTRYVVPGWPLFLAAGFRLVGPFAACTSNVLLFLLALLLLARFLGDLLRSPASGCLAATVCLLFLFGGYAQNPHYLLFPYRQTPFYLPTLLALFAVRRSAVAQTEDAPRPVRSALWIFAALAAVALATAVRETSPIILPSFFAFFLFSPLPEDPVQPAPPHARLRLLAVLAGFCLLGALAALVLILAMPGRFSNMQTEFFLSWIRRFFSQSIADLPLWRILAALRTEYGWLGLALLALGLVRACGRRHRPFLFLFALPALSYLLFDGLFKSNPRYVLSTLFFSAPLAALGADGLLTFATARLACLKPFQPKDDRPPGGPGFVRAEPKECDRDMAGMCPAHGRDKARPSPCGHGILGIVLAMALRPPLPEALLSLILLAVAFIVVLPSIRVERRVTRAEVERMLDLLRPHASESRPVVLDARHDVLLDLLPVFSPWPAIHVYDANDPGMFLADPPLAFVQSLSRRAIRPATIAPDAIAVLEGVADLRPAPDGSFTLGGVPYDLVLLAAPTNRSLALPLPPPPTSRRSPPPPVTFLRLASPVCAATNPISATLAGRRLSDALAPGREFLAVPTDLLASLDPADLVLELSAPAPFPAAFHPEWLPPDAPLSIGFGPMVFPSTDHFLSGEFLQFNDTPVYDKVYPGWLLKPHAREFARPGFVSLPAFPAADRPLAAILSFRVSGLHHEPESHLFATITFPEYPGLPPMEATIPHSENPQAFSFLLPPLPALPTQVAIALSRDIKAPIETFPNRRRFNSCLHSVSVAPLYPVNALTVDFAAPDDEALLLDGFFRQEGLGTRAAGRWMAPSATLVLPPLASPPPAGFIRFSRLADLSLLDYRSYGSMRLSLLADLAARPDADSVAVAFVLPDAPPVPAARESVEGSSLVRFSADLPAAVFSAERPTLLEISVTPPFCPADFGSKDARSLGLFAKSFSLESE